jgi:hypothetical protein
MEYFITRLPFKYPDRRKVQNTWGTFHTHKKHLYCAIDIMMPFNTNVYAVETGKVIDFEDSVVDSIYNVVKTGSSLGKSKIGNFITLEHTINNFSFYTSYFHLKNQSIKFNKNDLVKAGDVIGKVGRTGYINGVHLHFQAGIRNIKFDAGEVASATLTNKVNYKDLLYSDTHSGKLYKDKRDYPRAKKWYLGSKFAQFSANYDSQASFPKLVAGGPAKEWWIKFKNTGDIPWENHNKNNQVTKLALGTYSEPDIEEGQQFNCGWQSETRITSVEPKIVKPGEIGTFKFKVQAPEDISVEDSPFTLQVTPKTPDGWLRDDNGNELNCFAKISVIRNEKVENANKMNQEVDDNYTEKEVNDSKIVCPNNKNSNDDNEQSIQNQKANKDILKAAWVEKRSYHKDQVQVDIEFQESVSDDENVKLSLYEYQKKESTELVKDVITANVKAFKMGIDITADFLDTCMTKGVENQFYFSCLVENGDTEPAKSDLSYVDLPYVVSL